MEKVKLNYMSLEKQSNHIFPKPKNRRRRRTNHEERAEYITAMMSSKKVNLQKYENNFCMKRPVLALKRIKELQKMSN